MTPLQFVDKWRPVVLTERAAAQEHFIDLCRLFDHPTPVEADPLGESFTFEKGVQKAGGGDGFADVWKRGFFAWEYKKRKRNLEDALGQLARYALALQNPPLQIACDTDRFRIVTAYTNSVPRSYDLSLEDLLDSKKRSWLEAVFYDPKRLQPGANRQDLTQQAANKFCTLTESLQRKGYPLEDIAHFVNRLVFLFFAEDVGLLKENYFRRVLSELSARPSDSAALLTSLFLVFKTGGRFGIDRLPWINGGLFDDRAALALDTSEIALLKAAGSQDWAHIDPSIFGTLFERFLDPDKRAQIGAHYTDAAMIEQIINPVIICPLMEEWQVAFSDIQRIVAVARTKSFKSKEWQKAEERRSVFLERLRKLTVLDPACGSGNFLYLALHAVKNLEHAANQECEALGLAPRMPVVGPEILRGIEINSLAAELARTTVWIGDIQWAIQNNIHSRPEPILRSLDTIECRDAIVNESGGKALWPRAEFIVGNPPFLGAKLFNERLGKSYATQLRSAYAGTVPGTANLVCYWFDKATDAIIEGDSARMGLVATTAITQPGSVSSLNRLQGVCDLHDVMRDEPWNLEGAAVRVSIICGSKSQRNYLMNEREMADAVSKILGRTHDLAAAKLKANKDICFEGFALAGNFNVEGDQARKMLKRRGNVNGKSNSDVIRPLRNGRDIVGLPRDEFVVDFGRMSEAEASLYDEPFAYIESRVKAERQTNNREARRLRWWQFGETRPGLRDKSSQLTRQLCVLKTSKYLTFVWTHTKCACDGSVNIVTRDDDFMFGCLQNRFHEAWSLMMGGRLEDRPRYTPTTTFETFPFPKGAMGETICESRRAKVISAARKLDQLRNAWLYPVDMVEKRKEVVAGFPDRLVPLDAAAALEMKTRTITKLYNQKPKWLADAHESLDTAIAEAYGWPSHISLENALTSLFDINRSCGVN